ncbi:Uu.00g064770.m01.CDS01 [Anthostomella pinea]|uniref:Uu.00g064770.m01.CDS01 n=1 Tax=Anthostomella pinea TaxID=933095 RepID=A0AAI8VTL0_9PEZI|nr:Uu.00g064770.m01.CDS01 [Anthostomella pinea]
MSGQSSNSVWQFVQEKVKGPAPPPSYDDSERRENQKECEERRLQIERNIEERKARREQEKK